MTDVTAAGAPRVEDGLTGGGVTPETGRRPGPAGLCSEAMYAATSFIWDAVNVFVNSGIIVPAFPSAMARRTYARVNFAPRSAGPTPPMPASPWQTLHVVQRLGPAIVPASRWRDRPGPTGEELDPHCAPPIIDVPASVTPTIEAQIHQAARARESLLNR